MTRCRTSVLVATILVSLLGSCGAPSGPVPSPLPASPTPAPTPSPSAFAYVLDPVASSLLTFGADDATGQLGFVEGQDVPEGRQLAVDPRGRFVYVAGGHLGSSVGYYLRSYAVATATGRLDHRSNAPVSVTWPATSLAANERQIYVLGAAPYTGNHGGWSVFDVDLASGSLTRAPNPPLRWEPDLVVRDLESRFVYSAAVERIDCFYCSRLFVSALRADGTLQDVGGMTIDPESGPVVRGTAAVAGPGLLLVADTRGRITSYAVDGTTGSLTLLARLDPAFAGGAARLALARRAGEQLLALGGTTELRVYAVGPSGSLTLRDEMVLTSSARARSVAFHPSGRFLYASGEGEGVRVFAVAEDGRLQDIGREARGGGPLVVIGR